MTATLYCSCKAAMKASGPRAQETLRRFREQHERHGHVSHRRELAHPVRQQRHEQTPWWAK